MPLGHVDNHPTHPLRLIGILWTPPYPPSLQPIEEFWGGGKNYCASLYKNGRKVKQCIEQLRAGWYGDGDKKSALPCDELVARAMKDADRRLKEVGGLTGSMATGVSVSVGAIILPPDRMATDMTHRHVEAVDLTRDDTEEDPAPQELTEEDHRLGQMRALEEGSVALEPSQDEVPVD